MATAGEVLILINAKDEASGKVDTLGSKITGLGPIALTAGAAVGAAIVAGLVTAITKAGELEQAVANISTIKPEIDTSQVFNALNEMQTRVPQSASQLGDALYDVFSSMNVPADAGLRLVEQFARGAVGAGTDVKTFGTAAMGVMNAYGLSAESAGRVSDIFFNTVRDGVITGQELASSLGPVTQSAKNAGVPIEVLGAMIAGVTKEGGPAAQNVNNLNNLFQKITTTEAQQQIRGLGIATTDSAGNFRPIIDVLGDVKGRLDEMSQEERAAWLQKAFPDAQARTAAQTILSQLDFVKQALATNETQAGSTERAYTTMASTFQSQMTLLGNSVSAIFTQLGSVILPMITPIIAALAQNLPGAIASAGQAFSNFGTLISTTVAPPIQKVIDFFGGPLPAAIAVASPLFAPLVAAWSNDLGGVQGKVAAALNPIKEKLSELASQAPGWWEQITSTGAQVWDAIQQAAQPVFEFIQQEGAKVAQFFETEWPAIEQAATTVFNAIQTVVETTLTIIGTIVQAQLVIIKAAWDAWGPTVIAVVQTTWEGLKQIIDGALTIIMGLIKTAISIINGDWSGAWEGIKQTLSGVWEVIKGIVTIGVGNVVTLIKGIGSQLGDIGTLLTNPAREMVDGFVSAVRGKISDAVQIGRDLIEGVARGIAQGAASVKNAAVKAAQDAFNATTAWLNSRSPSQRAADELGQPISEGTALGIDAGAPLVAASAVNMASAAVAAAAAVIPAGYGVGMALGGAIAQGMGFMLDRGVGEVMDELSRISAEASRIEAEAEITGEGQLQIDALIAKAIALNRLRWYAQNPGGVFVYGLQAGVPTSTFNTPMLASGGVVPARRGGGLYNLGEGGEAEAVIPLSQLPSLMRQGMSGREDYLGTKIEIHIHAPEGVVGDTGIRKLGDYAADAAVRRFRSVLGDTMAKEARRVW